MQYHSMDPADGGWYPIPLPPDDLFYSLALDPCHHLDGGVNLAEEELLDRLLSAPGIEGYPIAAPIIQENHFNASAIQEDHCLAQENHLVQEDHHLEFTLDYNMDMGYVPPSTPYPGMEHLPIFTSAAIANEATPFSPPITLSPPIALSPPISPSAPPAVMPPAAVLREWSRSFPPGTSSVRTPEEFKRTHAFQFMDEGERRLCEEAICLIEFSLVLSPFEQGRIIGGFTYNLFRSSQLHVHLFNRQVSRHSTTNQVLEGVILPRTLAIRANPPQFQSFHGAIEDVVEYLP